VLFNFEDVKVSNEWNLVSDSVIAINNFRYKIKLLNENKFTIIYLENKKDSISMISATK